MSNETSPVPRPVRAASDWAWRLLLLAAGLVAFTYLLGFLSEVVIPLVVATLLTALLSSVHQRLSRRMPRGAAAGLTVLGTIIVIVGLLTLVGSQISGGFGDMAQQVGSGVTQIRDWLRGTFKISDTQFDGYVDQLKTALESNADLRQTAARAGVTATHAVAGTFISLFALFFFLYDGPRIWSWVVGLFPRTARARIDSSGGVAWHQLTAYVRATLLVAAVDAVGITLVPWCSACRSRRRSAYWSSCCPSSPSSARFSAARWPSSWPSSPTAPSPRPSCSAWLSSSSSWRRTYSSPSSSADL